jgi:Asp/Glu/hydantoin racemase
VIASRAHGDGDARPGAPSRTAPATLGLVMLETRFPRPLGDVGHPGTFAFSVRRRIVPGASPRRVVVEGDRALAAPFIAAADALARDGVAAITTSCGFLALFQRELAAAVAVPVWTSSLLAIPELEATLPRGTRAGIVTVDGASLTAAHLAAVGVRVDTPVEGLAADSRFRATLLEDRESLDEDEARAATVAAAERLVRRHDEVRAIVLECTNMPPYAAAVRAATGLPVHDITTLVSARFAALIAAQP